MPSISGADRELYERDGVVCIRNVFDAKWVKFLRDMAEEVLSKPSSYVEDLRSADGRGRFFSDILLEERFPAFRPFSRESPAAEIAGRIMGATSVRLFYDQIFVKEPGTSYRTPWHQDQPYWPLSGEKMCSLWLALDPVPREVSVEYIRGSHRWKEFSPNSFVDGRPYKETGLPELPDIEAARDAYDIAGFVMDPGDCIVFHSKTVHGSPGNPTTNRRRAIVTRWIGEDVRYARRPGQKPAPCEASELDNATELDRETFPVLWQASS